MEGWMDGWKEGKSEGHPRTINDNPKGE